MSKFKESVPQQLEIKYFWPLVEQIPLDLDYTQSSYSVSLGSETNTLTPYVSMNNTYTSVIDNNQNMEIQNLSLVLDKTPSFLLKCIYKFLNIKWKVK